MSDIKDQALGGKGYADNAGPMDSAWDPAVASSLGYGKGGHAGARFAWWIPVLAGLLAIGSYIAWGVLIFRGRDATNAALAGYGVKFDLWGTCQSLLVATAVMYPIFVVLALGVSVWRWVLARKLDIHRPDAGWMRSSRAYQSANAAANALLWFITFFLVVSSGAHWVWAFTGRGADWASQVAIQRVDPVWSGINRILDSTNGLVTDLNDLRNSLPAVGRRRSLLSDGVASVLAATIADTVATQAAAAQQAQHARQLQQNPLQDFANGVGTLIQGLGNATQGAGNVAQVVTNVTRPLVAAASPVLGSLPQILPNGSSNPLFNLIDSGIQSVNQSIAALNDGCRLGCISLKSQAQYIEGDTCICNLDRVKAGAPYVSQIYSSVWPAWACLLLMYVAASWLLMHGAAQWARTRTEAKLLRRVPGAAALQRAVQGTSVAAV